METANKKFRYSIRKFKVGVGSVLIATCLLGAGVSTPIAFATTEPSTATQVEAMAKVEEVQKLVKELEKSWRNWIRFQVMVMIKIILIRRLCGKIFRSW